MMWHVSLLASRVMFDEYSSRTASPSWMSILTKADFLACDATCFFHRTGDFRSSYPFTNRMILVGSVAICATNGAALCPPRKSAGQRIGTAAPDAAVPWPSIGLCGSCA